MDRAGESLSEGRARPEAEFLLGAGGVERAPRLAIRLGRIPCDAPSISDEITVWGSGNATREFLYVDDAAKAIVLATERYDKPEPVNLGSSSEISIRDLVTLIAKLTGFKGEIVWDATKPDGQPRRKLNVDRARKEFGFESNVTFEEGLRQTIDWYENAAEAEVKPARTY